MEWDTSHLPLKEDVLLSHLKAALDVPSSCMFLLHWANVAETIM